MRNTRKRKKYQDTREILEHERNTRTREKYQDSKYMHHICIVKIKKIQPQRIMPFIELAKTTKLKCAQRKSHGEIKATIYVMTTAINEWLLQSVNI